MKTGFNVTLDKKGDSVYFFCGSKKVVLTYDPHSDKRASIELGIKASREVEVMRSSKMEQLKELQKENERLHKLVKELAKIRGDK
jgi:hypothetical protein